VVVLVATSHRQLVRGRDDRRAAHRAATPVLVAGALAIAVVSPLYVRWYLNPSPAAVVGTPVAVPIDAPDLEPWVVPGWTSRASELGGGWRMITGRAAGRHPETWFTWLVHDDDRRALLLRRSPAFVERGFRRAANAQRIAWLTSSRVGGAGTVTLHYADLDRGEVEPKATRWSWTGLPVWRFAADGESIEILVARDAWKRLPLPPR
jgi:hypothetical protein